MEFPSVLDRLPVRDEILLHPDDFRCVPPSFVEALGICGVTVKPFVFMERYKILCTGKAASLFQSARGYSWNQQRGKWLDADGLSETIQRPVNFSDIEKEAQKERDAFLLALDLAMRENAAFLALCERNGIPCN